MVYVVNLKLVFTNWFFFNNLVKLIMLCKIRYLNIDKALLIPRNQAIFLKKWKIWWALTAMKFNIFYWNFAHVSYLIMYTKVYSKFLLFCLDLVLLIEMWKVYRNQVYRRVYRNQCIEVCRNQVFWIFTNNLRSE